MTKFLTMLAVGAIAGGSALTGVAGATASATTRIEIRHVQKGCHVWSKGGVATASLRLIVQRGTQLQIRNQDMKPHELVQVSGHQLALTGHMMAGVTQVVTFKKRGVYRFKTRTLEMGPPMADETIGPDNLLRLKVTVK